MCIRDSREASLQGPQQSAHHAFRGDVICHPGKDPGELVAAEPGGGVSSTESLDESGCHSLEQCIAYAMAERVIHLLEFVEIHDHERHPVAIPLGSMDRLLQSIEEEVAVGKIG